MAGSLRRNRRAISPVVGVAILLGIVVTLSMVSGALFLGLSEEREPAPDTRMTLEPTENTAQYAVVHETGDTLVGEKVELAGTIDPNALDGTDMFAGDSQEIYAVDRTVQVIWHGDHGTSYVIHEFEVDDDTVPEPDKGCPWVESESNDGTDDVKIVGLTVDCDVETDKVIEIQNDSTVIGDTVSNTKEVDADDARLYGDVTVDDNLNIQNGTVTGDVTSNDLVKIDDSTVGGSIDAVDTVEVIAGSSVDGTVVSDGFVKVLSSDVSGAVVSEDSVKVQDSTVESDVYVNSTDFDCTNSTINDRDCAEYTPKDPDDY